MALLVPLLHQQEDEETAEDNMEVMRQNEVEEEV